MRFPTANSLRTQVGFFLLLLAGVAGGFFLFGWLPHNQRLHLEEQREHVQEHLATLTDAILPYLLQNQLGAVHETLDTLLERQPNWRTLTLTDEGGQRLYPVFPVQTPDDAVIFPFSEEILFRGRKFGQISLAFDAGPLLASSAQSNREITVIFFGVMFTAFAFIAVFLEMIAGRPARQLADAAERLAESDYDAALPTAMGNEIGELIQSFDQMRATIRAKETSLIEARQLAESANRAKSMFLGNMSHELRTPLNSVLGFAQLLELDPAASDWQRDQLSTIRKSGDHLLEMLNDLLALSQFEEASATLDLTPFNPRDLLSDIGEMFREQAEEKGLAFAVEVSSGQGLPETLIGDTGKIRQVVRNLVGNAVKFTESGSVRLEAGWSPGDRIVFQVADTGPGIDPVWIDSIFDPFNRGDREGSCTEGTGLGLAVARKFVESMGGVLRIDSRLGEGSVFVAEVPVELVGNREREQQVANPG